MKHARMASANAPLGRPSAVREAGAVARELKGFPGVAAVAAPRLDAAGDAALIQVVPATAPSATATANLVTGIRDQAGAIERATGATVAVTGTTALNVDVSAKLSAALIPFACDALLVRMTAVPAVLALAGRAAWYLPAWLDRILPDLDVEGASLSRPEPAPGLAGELGELEEPDECEVSELAR